jgi:hypothetical protein
MTVNLKDSEVAKFRNGNKVAVVNEDDGISLKYEQASSSILYIGEGLFGALTSEPKWRIKKIETLTNTVTITCASSQFDQVWDNRAVLTYV